LEKINPGKVTRKDHHTGIFYQPKNSTTNYPTDFVVKGLPDFLDCHLISEDISFVDFTAGEKEN